MTDITKQTEDELRATIANAQARLVEIEQSKQKCFRGQVNDSHLTEQKDFIRVLDCGTNIPTTDIPKLIAWVTERTGGQAPQEPCCEIGGTLELEPV